MIYEFRKITIIKSRKPAENDINKDLQWFSESLGLFSDRDKERSCFRIFVELVKSSRRKQLLSSNELAERTNLSRGTVIHHINRLIESGLVSVYDGKYLLRVENLETLVAEVQKDLNRVFSDLKEIARELDSELGLLKREKVKSKVIE